MTAYETYKDSGIDWIEKIPSHWEVWPFKHHYRFEKGKNAQKYTQDYIGLNSGEYPVYSGQTENEGVMGTINSYEYVFNEPVLFSTTVGAKAMTLITLNGKFSLSQNCALFYLRKKNRLDFKYGFYYTQRLFDYEKGLIALSMQPSLRFEDLQKYSIIIPPLPEQRQIAAYLDYKTNQIDRFIANRKKQIELLEEQKEAIINKAVTKGIDPKVKLKPSGVNWIGDIPEQWEVKKLKFIGKHITTKGIPAASDIKISPENVESNTGICFNKYSEYEGEGVVFKEKDILLNKLRLYLKKVLFAEYEGYSMGEMIVIRIINSVSKFYYFTFFHQGLIDLLEYHSTGVKMPRVAPEIIFNFYYPFPPQSEQEKIVEFIENELSERNELISKYQKQIDLIQEYKTSLISKAVTGKIDVREWQPKQTIKETV